jgi:subtilisin-like proprotein convertase family protein
LRRPILTLALVVLLPLCLSAEVVTLDAGQEPVSVRVAESIGTRTVLEYELSNFTRNAVEIDGEIYYTIGLGDESKTYERGFPALPNVCRSIIVPDDAEMAVRVLSAHYVDYQGVPIEPSKGVITRDIDPATVAYTFDPFYESDNWYPADLATSREPYIMRDHRGVVVVLNPIRYNPATQTLRVYDSVTLEVDRVGSAKVNELTFRPDKRNIEFEKIYQRHFVNYAEVGTRYPSVPDVGNMLVIAYGDFMDEMEPLVEWKNQMGVPCEMISVADAGGSSAGIDATIEQYYYDNGLTYVLLVGDLAQCPSLTQQSHSDPSYSLITADTYPELFIGRFSAQSGADAATQVLRTVEYEKRPMAEADWYHKGMGIASNQGPGDDGEYDDEHQDNIRADLLAFTYTHVDQIYDPSGTASQVSTGVNDGRSTINYTGHGSETTWVSTGFSNTHVNALTNDNKLPFITSVACVNGAFGGTCFAEAWLRATNGTEPTGAIGFWGSTINQSWDPPMDGQDEVIDLLVTEQKRTFGALCFNGAGHMMDEYGSSGVNEFYHWTVFGDPSVRVRTNTPAEIDVAHLPVMYPGMATFDVAVSTAVARDPVKEAICALYSGGVRYGHAVTNASGEATITLLDIPPVGQMMTLTVTAFNTMTYDMDIPVIVPVTYDIDPPTVPVNVSTDVTVTIWDDEGYPKPDVEVTIDGWSIAPAVDVTDAAGEAHFTVLPTYGEDLSVIGSEIGEVYNCLEDVLPVTGASDFTSADVEGNVPAIGLYGMLAPHYEGTITGTASDSGFTLHASGCGIDASVVAGGTTVDLFATPNTTGIVAAAIGKSGFNVYLEDVSVIAVFGQLAGGVFEAGRLPIVDAKIKGYPAGADTTGATPLFETVSGAFGVYEIEGDLEVGYYDVYVSKFGYLPYFEEVFVQYGANDADFYMSFAPAGVVSGTVTEVGTGTPLDATIKIYRADNMELYLETTSDAGAGGYYEATLPYFNYEMNVRAWHHIPESRGIAVDAPGLTEDFVLEETLANILVIDDDPRGGVESSKIDEHGNTVYWTGSPDRARSAAQIAIDLLALGYDAVEETAAGTDPGTWLNYDFIVWAAGDNTSPVADATKRAALETYVASSGKLLIEGGEVGYDAASYPGYDSFAANVLHITGWNHDSSGTLQVEDGAHPVASFPNALGQITFTYSGYGDQDSNDAAPEAHVVCDWSSYAGEPGVLVYDDTPNPLSGQIVYWSFNYLAGSAGRIDLLENTVTYLTAQEAPPNSGISGTVALAGQLDSSGIMVTCSPGGDFVYTGPTGDYEFNGLYPGTYTVTATKDGWTDGMVEGVIVVEDAVTTGVNMMLFPLSEDCDEPSAFIPDGDLEGITRAIDLTADLAIDEIAVFVDITHGRPEDLIVELTSPGGTTVRLHNLTSGDVNGWYPTELTVDGPGSLEDFVGENCLGTWELFVCDEAYSYIGVLNSWCISAVGSATGIEDGDFDVPGSYVLGGISPNPFNPVTKVSYGLPETGRVALRIYSVSGRLVRTLVNGRESAGYHEAVWDGRDDRGVEVATGVYFCRMQAEGFSDSAKMVLLK